MRDKHMTKTLGSLSEEQDVSAHKQARLSAFLSSAATIKDVGLAVREGLMAELIVLGHHPAMCKLLFTPSHSCSPQSYPADYQADTHVKNGSNRVRADPYNLVNKNVDKLFEIVLAASIVDCKV